MIYSYQKQNYFNMKLDFLMNRKIKIVHTSQSLGFWLSLRLDILSFLIYSIMMILIGFCVFTDKYELITFLSLGMTTALNLTSPLSSFLPWLGITEDKFRAVERIRTTIDKLEDEREQSVKMPSNQEWQNRNNNFNSAIEFKDVYLKYDNIGKDILKDISFNINKGQKIAIIGRFSFNINFYRI